VIKAEHPSNVMRVEIRTSGVQDEHASGFAVLFYDRQQLRIDPRFHALLSEFFSVSLECLPFHSRQVTEEGSFGSHRADESTGFQQSYGHELKMSNRSPAFPLQYKIAEQSLRIKWQQGVVEIKEGEAHGFITLLFSALCLRNAAEMDGVSRHSRLI
jgi:hypothetical protein